LAGASQKNSWRACAYVCAGNGTERSFVIRYVWLMDIISRGYYINGELDNIGGAKGAEAVW
jgi:hypothetical protein